MTLSRFLSATVFGASTLLTALSAQAHTVTTDPVSAFTYNFIGFGDVHMSIPLQRAPVFDSRIESIDPVTNTITFANSPGWESNELVSPENHFLFIKSGVDEGMWLMITANDANSVVVSTDEANTLNNLVVGELAAIIPYWTPLSFFRDQTPDMIDMYLHRGSSRGVNLAATMAIYHSGKRWADLFVGGQNTTHLALLPSESPVVRNHDETLLHTIVGSVPMAAMRTVLRSYTAGRDEDSRLSFNSPVPVPLIEANVAAQEYDIIWTFDNDRPGYGKAATRVYEFYNGIWYDYHTGRKVGPTLMLIPGDGYVYRKYAVPAPDIHIWKMNHPHLD